MVLLSACEDGDRAFEKKDEEDEYKRVRGMLTLVRAIIFGLFIGSYLLS